MEDIQHIKAILNRSIETKQAVLNNGELLNTVKQVSDLIVDCLKGDGKILFCGNGGSAADAQHLAAELSGRFYQDREPLFAEALHVNTSYLTAVANDYSYNEVYSRMVKAKGRKGDVLIGLSTSGNSENIVKAMEIAKINGLRTVGMSGEGGGKMKEYCEFNIMVPSKDTPRIQECHITIGHIICELVEIKLFSADQ